MSPDLIALSETWHNSSSFFIPILPNYDFISSSFSCNKAGGVAIFLKRSYSYHVRHDLKLGADMCEDLWLEVAGINGRSAVVGVIYRHPGCNILNFQKHFEELIFNLNKSSKPVYIAGDFNIHFSLEANSNYINSINSLGYQQFVNSTTHFNMRTNSSSIIDHFYSDQPLQNISVKVLISDVTDHFPILAWVNKPQIAKKNRQKITRRDTKLFDSESFLNDLSHALGNIEINDETDPNQAFEAFLDAFANVLDTHAPYKELSRREVKMKHKPWMTKKLQKLFHKKNKLYRKMLKTGSSEDIKHYKNFSNILNSKKKQLTKEHYNKVIKKSTRNSKLTWQVINDIVKLKPDKGNVVHKVHDTNGVEISDPEEVPDIFNSYFASIGEKLSKSFSTSTSAKPSLHSQQNSFYLNPISVDEVYRYIKEMDASKSVRPSDPSIHFIKIAAAIISPVLIQLVY